MKVGQRIRGFGNNERRFGLRLWYSNRDEQNWTFPGVILEIELIDFMVIVREDISKVIPGFLT